MGNIQLHNTKLDQNTQNSKDRITQTIKNNVTKWRKEIRIFVQELDLQDHKINFLSLF